jgi:AraC-like DNA-binding protein
VEERGALVAGRSDAGLEADPRDRLVTLLGRLAPRQGRQVTAWPALRTFRTTKPAMPDPAVYLPSICIVAQGAKEARLGDRVFRYDPFHYLVIGADMPVRAGVVQASERKPFLSMILDIGTAAVRDLLLEMEERPQRLLPRWDGGPPLRVSPVDGRFLDAAVRLLEAVADPLDRRILAPAAARELVYLALRGDQGDLLRRALRRDGRSPGIVRALHHIHRHLHEPLDVPGLARAAGMSASSLHHGFKSATTLSPIQYVKRLRLDRARQLMLDEGCQAAEAALRVGYESASQFSREFKRLFGLPPRRYLDCQSPGAPDRG